MIAIPASSRIYVRVPVTADVDVTADVVQIAFIGTAAMPVETDWQPAAWANGAARILIGPGALVLPVGTYSAWVRVTDNPERPVLKAADSVQIV